jgi:protein required for attachment to host cells
MKKVWLLVADAGRAFILACGPKLDDPEVVREFENPKGRMRDVELSSDDTGRTRPRARNATAGSAMGHSTSPHEVAAEEFSSDLASVVRDARNGREFDELILVAPPAFLGLLRQALDKNILGSVRDVAKDYTGDTPATVVARVREQLDLP